MENEVTNSICTLDRVFVAIKSGKKPGVLMSDKFAGLICPEYGNMRKQVERHVIRDENACEHQNVLVRHQIEACL